jgi:hypothetical protein
MLRVRSLAVLLSAASLVLGLGVAPVAADNGKKSPASEATQSKAQKDKSAKKEKKTRERGGKFRREDRVTVRDFYSHNPSALPPGLAKRGGKLPPGLAKRGGDLPPGLARGQVITPEIEVHLLPLPHELEIRLPPPPHEVIRRIIGRDIVLIHERNRKVLDVMRDALP